MKNKYTNKAVLLSILSYALAMQSAFAASPLGKWTTIDDRTGKTKAVIEIFDAGNNSLSAKVVRTITHPNISPPLIVCDLCKGERKGQPIIGMVILWNMKPDGPNVWDGGTILDPKDGKEYSSTMKLSDDGQTLKVRGYVAVRLFGRSQTWIQGEHP